MIYEYKCVSCKHYFGLDFPMHKTIKDGKHVGARCPACKSSNVKKMISYPSIQFKGHGFTLSKGDK